MIRFTYNIILPVKDSAGRIIDWKTVARCKAYDKNRALNFARKEYGNEADVKAER